MADTGSNQKQSIMQDEGLPQTVQNSKDDHVKEPGSISNEMPSTTNSTQKVAPIPPDIVMIPACVPRPLEKGAHRKRRVRFLSL